MDTLASTSRGSTVANNRVETLDLTRTLTRVRQGAAPEFGFPAECQPYDAEQGLRISHAGGRLTGYTDLVRFSDDFYVLVSDTTIHGALEASYITSGWVAFHFRLSGDSSVMVNGGASVDRKMARCHVACYPEGILKTEVVHSRSPTYQYVGIMLRPKVIYDQFGSHLADLPPRFRHYLEDRGSEYFHQSIPFSREMRRALKDIIDTRMTRDLRWQFTRARAQELVCRVIEALPDCTGRAGLKELHLRPRDLDRLQCASSFIEENLDKRYTIRQVARHAGVNRRKLTTGFVKVYGKTVFEFGRQLRMERAMQLLRADELNIGEIALRLGYDNPRAFSLAFTAHYGILPKDCRARLRRSTETY